MTSSARLPLQLRDRSLRVRLRDLRVHDAVRADAPHHRVHRGARLHRRVPRVPHGGRRHVRQRVVVVRDHEQLPAQALHPVRPGQVHVDGADLDIDPDDHVEGQPVGSVAVGEQHPAVRRGRLRRAGADRPRHGSPGHQAHDQSGAVGRCDRLDPDRHRLGAATQRCQRPRPSRRVRNDVDRQSVDSDGGPPVGRRVVGRRPELRTEVRRLRRRRLRRHVHGRSVPSRDRLHHRDTHVPHRASPVDERVDPVRATEVLGDAADIVDDVVDVAVVRTLVLQFAA